MNSAAELREVGFEEYTSGDGICLIEWAEKAAPLLPAHRYDVSLKFGKRHNLREITIAEIIEVAA